MWLSLFKDQTGLIHVLDEMQFFGNTGLQLVTDIYIYIKHIFK